MLTIPTIDETNYDTLVQKARLLIPHFAPEWTDLNDHDPGITTLQTLAWLVDNLNYYIDATGEVHRLKYLKLLGITPKREPSKGFIMLSSKDDYVNDHNALENIPKGTKFIAGEVSENAEIEKDTIVFESTEDFSGRINPARAFFRGKCDSDNIPKDDDIFSFIQAGQFMSLFSDSSNSCYIEFNFPLTEHFRIYMDIWANSRRKPYQNFLDSGFPEIHLQWSYWDGEQWEEISIINDETHALRISGFITFRIPSTDKKHVDDAKYYLRVTLTESENYDELPQLQGLYTDCIKVEQTNTINGLKFYKELPPSERLEWLKPTLGCAKERRWIRNFPNIHKLMLSEIPLSDEKNEQGQSTDIIELWLKNGHSQIEWTERETGTESNYNAPIFYFNRNTGEILFGDGFDGKQSPPNVCLVPKEIITSLWDKGNVRAGQIKTWYKGGNNLESKPEQRLSITNPQETTGGVNNSTSTDLEHEIGRILQNPKRIVTKEDYINIVKETPGLMIDSVNVIDSTDYNKSYGGMAHRGTVYIIVKPWTDSENDQRPRLKYWYRDVVHKHLNKYRLIGTELQILPANYARIEVSFLVRLFQDTNEARTNVKRKLRQLIDLKYRKQFGGMLVYSQIYSELEQLAYVAEVINLEMFCDNVYAEKTEQGNILVNPDALTYLDCDGIYSQFIEVEGGE